MKPFVIYIILLTFLSGCSITGKYYVGGENDFATEYIILRKDSTFKYLKSFDVGGTTIIEGHWKRKKDTLIINSFEKPPFTPSSIIEKFEPKLNGTFILVQNMDVSSYNSIISINNGVIIDTLRNLSDPIFFDNTTPKNITGIKVSLDSIYSIKIIETNNWGDCVLKDSTFNVKNHKANLFRIYLQPYNRYYGMKYFVDTKWVIKKGRIYLWRNEENKYVSNYFFRKKRKK